MAQPATEQQSQDEEKHTWPTSLLLNQAYAMTFACIKCNEIPKSCMNNDDGEIFCVQCAKDMTHASPVKAVQNMINKLKTKCLSILQDANNKQNDDLEGGNIVTTHLKDNQCDWTGMIKEWPEHGKECQYVLVTCTHCNAHKTQRKLLSKHVAECPEVSIECPLLCGTSILRKNTKSHLANECNESLLECTNDDCKMEIKRKEFENHINTQCDTRVIECEFAKYGCKVKGIKANELKMHLEQYQVEHLGNKFDFMGSQLNGKINELQQNNDALTKQLNDSVNKLNGNINELQQKNDVLTNTVNQLSQKNNVLTQQLQRLESKVDDETKVEEMQLNLQNNWVVWGDAYAQPRAFKIGNVVYCSGFIKSGTGNCITRLPVGWRPTKQTYFSQNTSNNCCTTVYVWSNGNIKYQGEWHSWLSLNGIIFVAR